MLRDGDKLMVTKLDRLARSVQHLGQVIGQINAAGASLVILDMGGTAVDTSNPTEKLILNMMSEGFYIFNTLSFHPKENPKIISDLLQKALDKVKPIDGREKLNLKWVKFVDVDEFGLKFAVTFDCTNRLFKNSQQNVVLTAIHETLAREGIAMSAVRLTTNFNETT